MYNYSVFSAKTCLINVNNKYTVNNSSEALAEISFRFLPLKNHFILPLIEDLWINMAVSNVSCTNRARTDLSTSLFPRIQGRFFKTCSSSTCQFKYQPNTDSQSYRTGQPVVVRLKWGETEYRGNLISTDSYMNIQLDKTEEYIANENKGTLGMVLIRYMISESVLLKVDGTNVSLVGVITCCS